MRVSDRISAVVGTPRQRARQGNEPRPNGLPVNQIDPAPLHERVYREVRHALISGKFEPGLRLTVRDLASALGTSPMPVRAALSRLVAERALTQIDKGTAMVPIVSREAFQDLMETRMLLEGEATRLSSLRFTSRDLAHVKQVAGELNACVDKDDIVEYLRLNRALKFAIYSQCGSEALIRLIESLWLQAGPFLRHLARDIKGLEKINYHDEAIAAIERGNGKAAQLAIRRDIRDGMRFLLRTAEFGAASESAALVEPRRS
jgi:DNA-binding GntR family transcriptional regulator